MESSWKKPFFTLYTGQAFSILSSSAVQFAIIWWITVQTSSALSLTIASLVGLLPQAVIGPFAGVWIDRYSRKKIMIIADTAVALSSLILALSFLLGTPPLWFVYIILFARALGETFHKPALQAAIPQLVPHEELTRAGGYGQMISSACSMVGPILGALLMSITTLQFAMLVDIIGALLAVLTLSRVSLKRHCTSESKFSLIADMKEGLKEIRKNRKLLRVSVPILLSTMAFAPIGMLLPLNVKGYFSGTAWHNGMAQTVFSVGMLVSAMLIGITGGMKKQFLMISAGIFLFGLTSFFAGIIGPNLFWVFCVLIFLLGTTGMLFNVPYTAYIQRTTPQQSLGKVVSLVTSVMSLAAPVGMLVAGPLSNKFGPNSWFTYAGVAMMIVGVLCYFFTREVSENEKQSC